MSPTYPTPTEASPKPPLSAAGDPHGAIVVWQLESRQATSLTMSYDLFGGPDFLIATVPRSATTPTSAAGVVQVDVYAWGFRSTGFVPSQFPSSATVLPYVRPSLVLLPGAR